MRKLYIFVLPVMLAGCGGGNDLTGPTQPSAPSTRVPTVSGNYSGTTTMVFPEVPLTVTCNTTTSVTQSGSSVSIAPLQLSGASGCAGISLPLGASSIDATGAIPSENGTFNQPSCGNSNYTASGGFFGRDFRVSLASTSRTCLNMNVTINLTRQ